MTAVCAYKDGKRIIIAADSMTVCDSVAECINTENRYKIQRVNNSPDCLIACAGGVPSILAITSMPNLFNGKSDFTKDYLVKTILPPVFSKLKACGCLLKKDGYYKLDCSIIIATKTRLFLLSDIGVVTEISKFACIGSGRIPMSTRYLQIKDKGLKPDELVVDLIRFAIEENGRFMYPIVVMENNQSVERKFVNK